MGNVQRKPGNALQLALLLLPALVLGMAVRSYFFIDVISFDSESGGFCIWSTKGHFAMRFRHASPLDKTWTVIDALAEGRPNELKGLHLPSTGDPDSWHIAGISIQFSPYVFSISHVAALILAAIPACAFWVLRRIRRKQRIDGPETPSSV